MDIFSKITLADREWARECIEAEHSCSADFSFEGNYIWREEYRQHIAKINDMLVFRVETDGYGTMFSSPIGMGDRQAAILAIRDICKSEGIKCMICGVTPEQLEIIKGYDIGKYEIVEMNGANDYIYEAEKLATLSGKKLHGKRNHINQFELAHEWKTVELTHDNIDIALGLAKKWESEAEEITSDMEYESRAMAMAFKEFNEIGLEGIILYVDGQPQAFTAGSMITSETVDVHFEKANKDLRGAYPMINREFVRYLLGRHPQLKYINREDDMNIEGLRKAKLSYHPAFMVRKHTLIFED